MKTRRKKVEFPISQEAAKDSELQSHISDQANPHEVSKEQLGLGDVVNTGDFSVPEKNSAMKFTAGGAYTELLKKVNTSSISANIDFFNELYGGNE